jgi:hypothetical protein
MPPRLFYCRVTFISALFFSMTAFGQAPSTISCPSGSGDWDILSVMMMQPSLTSAHKHLEGTAYHYNPPKSPENAYVYTNWVVTNQQFEPGAGHLREELPASSRSKFAPLWISLGHQQL